MDSAKSSRTRNRSPRVPSAASASKRSAATTSAQNGSASEWVEPALASPIPSFEDHGGGPYGVLEDMQPLGSRPSAKVRARVKPDGPRKTALQKSLPQAQNTASAQGTPESTPAPVEEVMPDPPLIMADDEHDDDYTPRPSKKPAKGRLSRSAAASAKPHVPSSSNSTPVLATPTPSSVATTAPSATPVPVPTASGKRSSRSAAKVEQSSPAPAPVQASTPAPAQAPAPAQPERPPPASYSSLDAVIDAAVEKSKAVGNVYLGLAIREVYQKAQDNPRLIDLLKAILDQTCTSEELAEFRGHIHAARKKLKARDAALKKSEQQQKKTIASSPPPELVPRQSIESPATVPKKPKISLKMTKKQKPAAKPASPSPAPVSAPAPAPAAKKKKRPSSVSSSSSLSSLTSMEDDNPPPPPPTAAAAPPVATEIASLTPTLAAPTAMNGSLKRSSVEAGNDESEAILQAKKQKLDKSVNRDVPVTESHIRPDLAATSKVHQNRIVPPVKLTANGVHSRVGSVDAGSPLTEMSSPSSSRRGTPKTAAMPTKVFKKKAKTKQSPVKKQALNQSGEDGGISRRVSPAAGYDVNEESDNNDFCSACGGSGFLLCCDGCDRSFHFSCLDPPLTQEASELEEPWYCFGCIAKRAQPQKQSRGLFSGLLSNLDKRNPAVFLLPQDIRDHFEGVATTKDGRFTEQVAAKTRRGAGWDELPDNFKTKDAKGQVILCYHCGLSSLGRREIITCDQCGEHWHLDCLDPPLANPPYRDHTGRKIRDWLCPLHIEHVLREMEVPRLADRQLQRDRRIHLRKPRAAKVVDTALNRGFINDGIIEIANDESESETEFTEEEIAGVVFRLPEKGIKLDFIDKVRRTRAAEMYYKHQDANTRPAKRARIEEPVKHNFFQRSFLEQRTALDLLEFANQQPDLGFNGDQVSSLIGNLIAQAPEEVVEKMIEAEKNSSTTVPPSPPSSDQHSEQSVAQQRKMLEMLQTLVSRKLAGLTGK